MAQIAGKFIEDSAITNAKINASAAIAYSKLSLANSVKASDINVEGATNGWILTSNGSSASFAATPIGERAASTIITLSGTDITNQFVDLEHIAVWASATDNSIIMSVRGGPVQEPNVDYVSDDGGTDDLTRITFLGDLATGGVSELIEGDVLIFNYEYT